MTLKNLISTLAPQYKDKFKCTQAVQGLYANINKKVILGMGKPQIRSAEAKCQTALQGYASNPEVRSISMKNNP